MPIQSTPPPWPSCAVAWVSAITAGSRIRRAAQAAGTARSTVTATSSAPCGCGTDRAADRSCPGTPGAGHGRLPSRTVRICSSQSAKPTRSCASVSTTCSRRVWAVPAIRIRVPRRPSSADRRQVRCSPARTSSWRADSVTSIGMPNTRPAAAAPTQNLSRQPASVSRTGMSKTHVDPLSDHASGLLRSDQARSAGALTTAEDSNRAVPCQVRTTSE